MERHTPALDLTDDKTQAVRWKEQDGQGTEKMVCMESWELPGLLAKLSKLRSDRPENGHPPTVSIQPDGD